ncbi:MAG: tetratricopeptide repeat protein [Pseudomonadota bacterium]
MRALPTLLLTSAALAAGLGGLPATASGLTSMAQCMQRISQDPQRAREEAAQWLVLGGGAEARACEARALEALGARATAAVILVEVAADWGNGLPAFSRAAMMRDAGRLWLAEGNFVIAEQALTQAISIGLDDADTRVMRAEARGRQGLWTGAISDLDTALASHPDRADLLALRAAARRKSGDTDGALTDAEAALALLPTFPEALFEKGAALAVSGRIPDALAVWFELIRLHPETEMAELARRNMQQLAGN